MTQNETASNAGSTSTSALSKQEGGSHYKGYTIQPIEYAMANNLNYCQANVVKYTTRYRDKNGLEDLLKAIHNLEILIEMEYGVGKTSSKSLSLPELRIP